MSLINGLADNILLIYGVYLRESVQQFSYRLTHISIMRDYCQGEGKNYGSERASPKSESVNLNVLQLIRCKYL